MSKDIGIDFIEVAQTFEKAWRIGEHHANSNKPIMSKELMSETYFSGPDWAVMALEYGFTREEIHMAYAKGYRHAINARVQVTENA